jgi:hypothetical protein
MSIPDSSKYVANEWRNSSKAANRAGAYDDYINTIKTRFATGPRKQTSTPPTP